LIRLVFFDVGGTLIHPHPSVGTIYSEVAGRHGVNLSETECEARFKSAWKVQKQGGGAIDEKWWHQVVRKVFENNSFPDFELFFKDVYSIFEQPHVWKIFDDVLPTLSELKKRGLRLAIASNWDERLPPLLDQLNLSQYFEKEFISFEMGISKPNPQFFRNALAKMDIPAIEAIHIGDDEVEDGQCAESAGLRAYIINRNIKPINSRMLVDLREVLVRI